MELKILVGAVIFSVYSVLLTCSNPISSEEGDVSRQCMKYDLVSTLNLTIDRKIVVVYNSALCKRCIPKLLSFKALQLRFEIAGFNDIHFVLLTTEHSNSKQFAELQSRASDIQVISLHDIDNDFFVAGTIYVFDKCLRLTYELFPPWSDIQYQLVKAAILSTLYDVPCGKCDEINLEELSELLALENDLTTTTDSENETETETETSSEESTTQTDLDESDDTDEIYHLEVQSNDTAYVVNLRTIIPLPHVHHLDNNTYIKYNYIILDSSKNSSNQHEHLSSDNTEILYDDQAINAISANDTKIPEYLRNAEGFRYKVIATKSSVENTTENAQNYAYLEVKDEADIVVIRPTLSDIHPNITSTIHATLLDKLRKWISYRLYSPFYHV